MPIAGENNDFKHVVLAGDSGVGKSALAYFAPKPLAALLLDKSTIDLPPGVEQKDVVFKRYPPAIVNLADDKHGRARNIADAIIADIQCIRDHFTSQKPLRIRSGLETTLYEVWPTPKTVVIEGADFLSQHITNLICARHGKKGPSEFANKYECWGLRKDELTAIYDMLTYLPINIVITTGTTTNEDTGAVVPHMGGALDLEGPRKFHSCLLLFSESGKYKVRTRSSIKYRGFKLGGRFAADEVIDITIDPAKPINPWEKLFGDEQGRRVAK